MINEERIIIHVIKLATNIVNTVLEEIKHSQETSLKIRLLVNIQQTDDKNIQKRNFEKMKQEFEKDKDLLKIVEYYIDKKEGAIKNFNIVTQNFEKIYQISKKELQRLYVVLPKYYPQETILMKTLNSYLKTLTK